MQLHEFKAVHKFKKPKRVGRGGKKGTYCGRGIKGQKARAGAKIRPALRDLIERIPKLRSYRRKSKVRDQKSKEVILNLNILGKKFKDGERVTPRALLEKMIVRKIKGRLPEIKLLAEGSLERKLLVEGCQVSKKAREKIEKAGGKVTP